MNIARCFSYTLELEDQLKKLQQRFDKLENELKAERKVFAEERKELMDRLLQKNGVHPVHKPTSQPQNQQLPVPSNLQPKPFELPRLAANKKAKELEEVAVKSLNIRQAAQSYKIN